MWSIRAVVLILMGTICCQLQPLISNPFRTVNEASLPSRSIHQTSLGISELWRKGELEIWTPGYGSPNAILTSRQIILVDNRFGAAHGKIISLDTDDGSTQWEVNFPSYVSSLAKDQGNFYVTSSGEPPKAYDLQTGQLVWESNVVLPSRTSNFTHVWDNTLRNYTSKNGIQMIHEFDIQTGQLLSLEETLLAELSSGETIMRLNEVDLYENGAFLSKIDRTNDSTVWKTLFNTSSQNLYLKMFPTLFENQLVLTVGEVRSKITVLDFISGQRLWETERYFVSNVTVSQDKVYALRKDGNLLVFDMITGTLLDHVQFSPTQTDPNQNDYWVGVDEQERVFVYFGDSQELFALAPPP